MKYVENSYRLNDAVFSQEQIDHLSSLHNINTIDSHLRVVSSINIVPGEAGFPPRVILLLEIFYNNNSMGNLSFDLHNYEYDEIIHLAKSIRENEFLLQEVDNYLGADIVE